MMRLSKAVLTKLIVEISPVISAADQDRLISLENKINLICSKAEDNMFRDHPELSNEYLDVFYGNIESRPRNGVDRRVIEMAREAADEVFDGKRY